MSRIAKPLHDRLRKNLVIWSDEHIIIVRQIKKQFQEIPCLHIANPLAPTIAEKNAFELGY